MKNFRFTEIIKITESVISKCGLQQQTFQIVDVKRKYHKPVRISKIYIHFTISLFGIQVVP